MEKVKIATPNIEEENIERLLELFPQVATEIENEAGEVERAVDIDALRDLIGDVAEGPRERYQFTWPGKHEAKANARRPITKTFRPCRKESLAWDETENLYIEGDNLDALKILRETYAGKIKMIYIDPPYNTGHDFVYDDNFSISKEDYASDSGDFDDEGGRLVANLEGNGRFHSDWCSMMFPRLILARDLLTSDGAIFVSIDENEVHNMRKIMDEVFGASNFVSQLGWQKVYSPKNQARYFSNDYEFILCYAKSIDNFTLGTLPRTDAMNARYKNPDNDPRGPWKPGDCVGNGERKNGYYDVISPITGKVFNVPKGKHWVYAPETMKQLLEENRIYFGTDGNAFPAVKQFLSNVGGRKASSLLLYEDYGHTDMAKKDLIKLFPELEKVPFDTPKPIKLIKMLTLLGTESDDIILDFFAGSATTAQSIFDLNYEEKSNRKFILVQAPEPILDNPGAIDVGLETISDVAMERIRRSGAKYRHANDEAQTAIMLDDLDNEPIDTGFRVLKIDSSNMRETHSNPQTTTQDSLLDFIDNVKEGRTDEDLLFQVLPKFRIPYSAPIKELNIHGKKVFEVDDGLLLACFDIDVTTEVIEEIAKRKPSYAVMRDLSFKDDAAEANFEELFKTFSPDTIRRVI